MTASDPPAYVPPPTVAVAPASSTNRRFASFRSILALILREMSSTYGRTPGGYAWEILEPALGIGLLTLIFSAGFRNPSLGTNFAIFYATGLVPFQMWNTISSNVAGAVRYSRPLLAYPAVTFLDALLARFLLAVLTQAIVSYMIISFIRWFYDTQTVVEFPTIFLGYTMIVTFALAIGLLNGFLFQVFPLYQNAWGIVTRPLIFVSGVIILFDTIPQPYRDWLWWNPLVHPIGIIRSGFYVRYDAAYADPIYFFIVTGVVGVTGLLFLTRYYRDILEI